MILRRSLLSTRLNMHQLSGSFVNFLLSRFVLVKFDRCSHLVSLHCHFGVIWRWILVCCTRFQGQTLPNLTFLQLPHSAADTVAQPLHTARTSLPSREREPLQPMPTNFHSLCSVGQQAGEFRQSLFSYHSSCLRKQGKAPSKTRGFPLYSGSSVTKTSCVCTSFLAYLLFN